MSKPPRETIKAKILFGYLFLIGIGAFTVWLIYSEILLYSENKTRITKLNNKILYFNSVLANLYQAETLERTYSQTGDPSHYLNYERLMENIHTQFDSLGSLAENPIERMHTDSILSLLDSKRKNLSELINIKRSTSADIYEAALNRFNFNRDTIKWLLSKRSANAYDGETTLKKKKFLEKLLNAFNEPGPDTLQKINKEPIAEADTVPENFNPADTIIKFLSSILEDLRRESLDTEQQRAKMESVVLENDRTITLQLREMLTIFEKDIFVNSLGELRSLQERIKLTTWYLIGLGAFALVVIIIFLILILKDITKSEHYRSELEHAKAYSDFLLKSKEQFMLSITHDIKSPIASVTGYARLMHETDNHLKKKQYLDNINKSAELILKLISDLFDLTRLETGKLKIENTTFKMSSLIHDIYEGFYPLAQSKNIGFINEFHINENQFYIGDPLRIKQILGNIISNAIKYTDAGYVKFIVSQQKTEGYSENFTFDVIDTGIGISEEDSKIIFNEFTRVKSGKGNQNEGVGLGLSISQKLISLLHGSISFTSSRNVGSHFIISLPLEKAVFEPEKISEKTGSEPETGEKKTIILIDDDVIFLQMTAEIIEKTGMRVYMCNSAINAIHLMEELTPDLIITDIQMPNMNGLDLLAFLQRKTGYYIPVIAVTGQESPHIEGVRLSACLKKPFLPEELLHYIGLALHTKSETGRKQNSLYSSRTEAHDGYTLNQLRRFVQDDSEGMQKILISFAETSRNHLLLFNQYIIHNDRKSLSELAHKMLAMFRQLEANSIVEPLMAVEAAKDNRIGDEEWKVLGLQTAGKIEEFLDLFCEEQSILIR